MDARLAGAALMSSYFCRSPIQQHERFRIGRGAPVLGVGPSGVKALPTPIGPDFRRMPSPRDCRKLSTHDAWKASINHQIIKVFNGITAQKSWCEARGKPSLAWAKTWPSLADTRGRAAIFPCLVPLGADDAAAH